MDKLGNRESVNVRDGNDVNYAVDTLTNRYDSIGANSLEYDPAGNLIKDRDGYHYEYDYENRIVEVLDDANNAVAQFAYDALGRRIRKKDLVADEATLYYYNGNWQVLAETDANGTTQRWFVYGNYIDEALMMVAACLDQSEPSGAFAHRLYYIQDGLYSTRALVADKGWVIEEQTYYDVYGRATTWTSGDADADGDVEGDAEGDDMKEFIANFFKSECDAGYNWRCDVDNSGSVDTTEWPAFRRSGSTPANQQSYFTNPYYFTGRRVDFLDNGSLKIQLNRHRYYDYYTGRWLTEDPLGYEDGLNLYEYVAGNPLIVVDPIGAAGCKCTPCEYRYIKRCWFRRGIKPGFKWMGSSLTELSVHGLSSVGLDALAIATGGTFASIVSSAANVIQLSLPSLFGTITVTIRPYKREHFSLLRVPCGDGCKWDIRGATINITDEIYDQPLYESALTPISCFRFELKELFVEYGRTIRRLLRPSPYCKRGDFTCTKGDHVTLDGEEQLCENFEWKTRD